MRVRTDRQEAEEEETLLSSPTSSVLPATHPSYPLTSPSESDQSNFATFYLSCPFSLSGAPYSLLPSPSGQLNARPRRRKLLLLVLLGVALSLPVLYILTPRVQKEITKYSQAIQIQKEQEDEKMKKERMNRLLGDYLSTSHPVLSDPYKLGNVQVNPMTLFDPPLDLDIDLDPTRQNASGLVSIPGGEAGTNNDGINPSAIFTPHWAAEQDIRPVTAYSTIMEDEDCLVQWVGEGTICTQLQTKYSKSPSITPDHLPPIDVLFTWVNGSDPLHSHAKQYWAYCMTAGNAIGRTEYCPTAFSPSDSEGGLELSLESEEERQAKFDAFLRDILPILVKADQGFQGRDYLSRKKRESSTGFSSSRFFEMNELKYAIRSTVQFLQHLGTIHVLSPHFPINSLPGMAQIESNLTGQDPDSILAQHQAGLDIYTDPIDGSVRAGQKPRWLNSDSDRVLIGSKAFTKSSSDYPQLRLHHDWSLFRPFLTNTTPTSNLSEESRLRKASVLPTFNSMAVESIMDFSSNSSTWGAGGSDTTLVCNDDFFFLRPIGHADIHSPLFGLVLRFQHDLTVQAQDRLMWSTGGEWPGLKMASKILDQRFGARKRRYPLHVHRSSSAALWHETRLMFREDLSSASRARFRGLGKNLVSHHLLFNMVMERHREAALWSFIMLVLDSNQDGQIDFEEFQTFRRTFKRHHMSPLDLLPGKDVGKAEQDYRSSHRGWATEQPGSHRSADRVITPRRTVLAEGEVDKVHHQIGLESKYKATEYRFTSLDGYALTELYQNAVSLFLPPNKKYPFLGWHEGGWPWYVVDPQKEAAKAASAAKASVASAQAEAVQAALSAASAAQQGALPTSVSGPTVGVSYRPGMKVEVNDAKANSPFSEDVDPEGDNACTIEWKACVIDQGSKWMSSDPLEREESTWSSQRFFTRFAFEHPSCGDCLLTHLVSLSGSKGLKAVLPPANLTLPGVPNRKEEMKEPHLPLSRTWLPPESAGPSLRGSDFSIENVASSTGWGGKSARTFVAKLLQRYAHVMGSTPSDFVQLGTGDKTSTEELLDQVVARTSDYLVNSKTQSQDDHKSIALLCINDDIVDHEKSQAIVDFFALWLQRTFPDSQWRTPFEM